MSQKISEIKELFCQIGKLDEDKKIKALHGIIDISAGVEPDVSPSIEVACIWSHFKNIVNGKTRRFTPPTIEECISYSKQCGYTDPVGLAEQFHAHYTSNGWMVGKVPMKNWKIAMKITWRRHKNGRARNYYTNQPTTIGQIKAGF